MLYVYIYFRATVCCVSELLVEEYFQIKCTSNEISIKYNNNVYLLNHEVKMTQKIQQATCLQEYFILK
jgi:hypothetical protein